MREATKDWSIDGPRGPVRVGRHSETLGVNIFTDFCDLTAGRMGWLMVPHTSAQRGRLLYRNFTICPPVLYRSPRCRRSQPPCSQTAEATAILKHLRDHKR